MENAKWKMVNGKKGHHLSQRALVILVFTFSIFHFPFSMISAPSAALADAPTQDDVFKNIRDGALDSSVDWHKVLAVLIAGVAIAIVLVVFSKRDKRQTLPKALNHQGKLLRELMKTAGLQPAQARQLKVLAEQLEAAGQPLQSPVTLMLCPSLMKKTKRET